MKFRFYKHRTSEECKRCKSETDLKKIKNLSHYNQTFVFSMQNAQKQNKQKSWNKTETERERESDSERERDQVIGF